MIVESIKEFEVCKEYCASDLQPGGLPIIMDIDTVWYDAAVLFYENGTMR